MNFIQMFRGYAINEKDGIFSARVNGKVIISSLDIKNLKNELKKIEVPLGMRDSFVKSVDVMGDR